MTPFSLSPYIWPSLALSPGVGRRQSGTAAHEDVPGLLLHVQPADVAVLEDGGALELQLLPQRPLPVLLRRQVRGLPLPMISPPCKKG